MPIGEAQAIASAIGKAVRHEELASKPCANGLADELRREIATLCAEMHREMNALAWKVAALLLAPRRWRRGSAARPQKLNGR